MSPKPSSERPLVSCGVDVGSSTVKVVVMESPARSGRERRGARVLAQAMERTRRRDQRQVLAACHQRALAEAGVLPERVDYLATTGEGELAPELSGRLHGHFYGMTAHARGALFLDPEARAAIDVGALHARAIRFDAGARVLDYRMTSQCAAGTGQFLENIARYLGVTLDEVGPLSQRAQAPEKVSGICAVLAETDVINMVSRGISTANIVRGIHESMAAGFGKLLRSARAQGVCLVTGGLSADSGLLAALGDAVNKVGLDQVVLRAHPDGVYAGALGAALWGAYRYEKLAAAEAGAQAAAAPA
jgi:benzoyl-CoA reductase subunit D